jgi:hypothetical protein
MYKKLFNFTKKIYMKNKIFLLITFKIISLSYLCMDKTTIEKISNEIISDLNNDEKISSIISTAKKVPNNSPQKKTVIEDIQNVANFKINDITKNYNIDKNSQEYKKIQTNVYDNINKQTVYTNTNTTQKKPSFLGELTKNGMMHPLEQSAKDISHGKIGTAVEDFGKGAVKSVEGTVVGAVKGIESIGKDIGHLFRKKPKAPAPTT